MKRRRTPILSLSRVVLVVLTAGLVPRAGACPVAPGEVWVPAGRFTMGMDSALPEESPRREVTVAGFFMDRTEVTNAQFAAFTRATGYRTQAERGWADVKGVPA